MTWYIGVHDDIVNCCGVWGFSCLPGDKEKLKKALLNQRESFPYEVDDDGDSLMEYGMSTAMIICTTNNQQQKQEQYLKEFGFQSVFTKHNKNSGNEVTLWVMSATDFDKLLDSWEK